LTEDTDNGPPSAEYVAIYADQTSIGDIATLGDPAKSTIAATPYNGVGRPGRCVLTPDMVILHCWVGENDDEGYAAIAAHAQ
jgi:hypothetical protein